MPPRRKKSKLPGKVCPVCNRPLVWGKKGRNTWDELRYCADRGRRISHAKLKTGLAEEAVSDR